MAFQPSIAPPPLRSGVGAGGLLDSLKDDDCLRSVLLWTAASDHLALRKSCRRIREMMDSNIFVQERCEQGFAEISVSLADPYERYKGEYRANSDNEQEAGLSRTDPSFLSRYDDLGYVREHDEIQVEAAILVDGREASQIEFYLLPMFGPYDFHELCDSISNTLQGISVLFFSRGGKPTRVKSVKTAYDEFCATTVPTDASNYLLYLPPWKLKPPYRTNSNVFAYALRDLLQHPSMKGRWCLAIHEPRGEIHMTQEELDNKHGGDLDPHARFFKKPTKEYTTLLEERTIRDMRYFLRAGFQQVPELVNQIDNGYYVFCVPSFLDSEMISNEQALAAPVQTRPDELSEEAQELRDFVVRQCDLRRQHQGTIKHWQLQGEAMDHPGMAVLRPTVQEAREDQQNLKSKLEENNARIEEIKRALQNAPDEHGMTADQNELHCELKQRMETIAPIQEDFDRSTERIEELKQVINKIFPTMAEAPVSNARKELEGMEDRLRSKLQDAVNLHGKNIVQDSNILHACATKAELSFLEVALEFVPPEERAQAINSRDRNQATPLMCAVESHCEYEEINETCRWLIKNGANKDLADGAGVTAFGKFRSIVRSNSRLYSAAVSLFATQLRQNEERLREIEPVLMPSNGPTEADDALLEEESSDVGDGWDWDD